MEAPAGDPDTPDFDEWSPEVMARSYERGRRSARRFVIMILVSVIVFDLAVAWLAAGWIVALSLAAPQTMFLIAMHRRPVRLNPYESPEGRKE